MSQTLDQIFIANPTTTPVNTDLFYLVHSPYTPGTDSAINYSNLINAIGARTVSSISGTLNQVDVSQPNGAVILSLPQPIAPTSSPTFNALSITTSIVTGNAVANNFAPATSVQVLVGGTVTLTNASTQIQQLGGSGGTLVLPNATTLVVGWTFFIHNNTSGNVTVQTNGGATLFVMAAGSFVQVIAVTIATSAGTWLYTWSLPQNVSWGTNVLTAASTAATFASLTVPTGNVLVNLGYIASGSPAGGAAGNFVMYSNTVNKGNFQLICTDNTNAWNNILQNQSSTASRTWTLPDASGIIQLQGASLGAASASSLAFTTTSGIIGTTTNDNAAAGSVGEYITATAGPISMTNATAADITSISLTAGDWDVWGNINWNGGATTNVTLLWGWMSSTSATSPSATITTSVVYGAAGIAPFAINNVCYPIVMQRVSITTATTIYLSNYAGFGISTLNATGIIYARRRR